MVAASVREVATKWAPTAFPILALVGVFAEHPIAGQELWVGHHSLQTPDEKAHVSGMLVIAGPCACFGIASHPPSEEQARPKDRRDLRAAGMQGGTHFRGDADTSRSGRWGNRLVRDPLAC
jgi:hypothetical protein